ncbi:MAG: copper amine oxidase N-terminal domain-containing protein [Peptoniphilus sp. oral taxon 375]|nr:copper amine oxidase N-terminal domain-containing protein [Peptoniphilus sp. oral taxon 375]
MHKKLAGLGLAACLVLSQGVYGASTIKIQLNGKEIKGDVAPQVKSERTFVPLRFVSEALGYKVDWFQEDQSVSIAKGQKQIKLWLGKKTLDSQGKKSTMDIAPYASHERTFVPLRFVAENLGVKVDWDQEKQTVILTDTAWLEKNVAKSFLQGVNLSHLSPEELAYVKNFDQKQQVLVQELANFRNLAFRDFDQSNKMEMGQKMAQVGAQVVSTAKEMEALQAPAKFKDSHELFSKVSQALPGIVEDYKAAFLTDDSLSAAGLTSKLTDYSVAMRQIVDQMTATIQNQDVKSNQDVDQFLKTKDDQLFQDKTIKNLMDKILKK